MVPIAILTLDGTHTHSLVLYLKKKALKGWAYKKSK